MIRKCRYNLNILSYAESGFGFRESLNSVKHFSSKNLRLNGHTSFKFQTRNDITCFDHICNHLHGQENHTQKYINMVLITV